MLENLKQKVYEANLKLVEYKLVLFTWGNVSEIDRESGLVVIKPSGVDYDKMTPDDMVVMNLNGDKVEGRLNPSSDTPTHLELYRRFPEIGGVAHTHSTFAVSFAQAASEIPCYGTTHADFAFGAVPCTRDLTKEEIEGEYELNTGKVIAETFENGNIDCNAVPAVLVHSHGPFTWGKNGMEAAKNSAILEEVAKMAYLSRTLEAKPASEDIRKKHYYRKHGAGAYYGQK
ncbi:MAG: L-ribulose-5-phosphate 4-epimerase [Clostridia bacterium]|nr:L-ribulose-5-phosphate 4-epimerase [Clostridia bacterium]MBR3818236.1 L-ribulose-5-phosphate 4-epimerase [Clostridia bacterium]